MIKEYNGMKREDVIEMIELLPLHTRPRMSNAFIKYTYAPNETQEVLNNTRSLKEKYAALDFLKANIDNEVYIVCFKPTGLADAHYGGKNPIRLVTVKNVCRGRVDYVENGTEHTEDINQLIVGNYNDVKLAFALEREISRQSQIAYINKKYNEGL